jgi:GNAT superfamily N-acetyltransferase
LKEAAMQFEILDKKKRRYLMESNGDDSLSARLNIYRLGWPRRRQLIGYVHLLWRDAHHLEFSDINLEAPFRNRGIGSAVLERIIQSARQRGIHVVTGRIIRKDARETPICRIGIASMGSCLKKLGRTIP